MTSPLQLRRSSARRAANNSSSSSDRVPEVGRSRSTAVSTSARSISCSSWAEATAAAAGRGRPASSRIRWSCWTTFPDITRSTFTDRRPTCCSRWIRRRRGDASRSTDIRRRPLLPCRPTERYDGRASQQRGDTWPWSSLCNIPQCRYNDNSLACMRLCRRRLLIMHAIRIAFYRKRAHWYIALVNCGWNRQRLKCGIKMGFSLLWWKHCGLESRILLSMWREYERWSRLSYEKMSIYCHPSHPLPAIQTSSL